MRTSIQQLDRILRGETTRLSSLRDGNIDVSVRHLALALLVLGLLYGLCMGLFSVIVSGGKSYWQLLATTVKVPLLFFLTLLVTFPSLYVFNALVGSRLNVRAVLRLLVAAMAVMLAVLASFGTIVAFFSVSSQSYGFILLLNVAVFAISGLLGMAFLLRTLHRLTLSQMPPQPPSVQPFPPPLPEQPAPPEGAPPHSDAHPAGTASQAPAGPLDDADARPMGAPVRTVFRIWVILFALVGAQMGWVLRPFVGSPGMPFSFFRPRGSNFLEAVFTTLRHLLGA